MKENIFIILLIPPLLFFTGFLHAQTLSPDINNNGTVDIQDLGILLSNWNQTGTNVADINGSGTVDIQDLGILLSAWGTSGVSTPTPTATLTPTATPTPVSGNPICEATGTGQCWYIALSGSDSDAGTFASPWRTWSRLNSVLGAGDYVYYRGGTYTDGFIDYDVNLNGAAGERVTVKPYPGEQVDFDGRGMSGCLALIRGSGIIIDGFEFHNTDVFGTPNPSTPNRSSCWSQVMFSHGGSYIEVRNNHFHNIVGEGNGNSGGPKFTATRHVEVHHNTFEDLRESPSNVGHSGNVAHLYSVDSYEMSIHHNWFSHPPGEDGITCYLEKHLALALHEVYENTFYNCATPGSTGGMNHHVHHNLFVNNAIGVGRMSSNGSLFEYNTIYTNEPMAVYSGYASDERVRAQTFTNNIVVSTTSGYPDTNYFMRLNQYNPHYSTDHSTWTFENNCYYTPNAAFEVSFYGGGGAVYPYTWSDWRLIEGFDAHSYNEDPQFRDPAAMDFTVRNTHCADKGVYAGPSPGNPPLAPWH